VNVGDLDPGPIDLSTGASLPRWSRRTYGQYGVIEHLGGVPWDEAPIPGLLHRCTPQSRWRDHVRGQVEERCACGGVRLDQARPWIERNTRTPDTPAEAAQRAWGKKLDALIAEFEDAEQAGDGPRMRDLSDQVAAWSDQDPRDQEPPEAAERTWADEVDALLAEYGEAEQARDENRMRALRAEAADLFDREPDDPGPITCRRGLHERRKAEHAARRDRRAAGRARRAWGVLVVFRRPR
jgi:hypothetical protein